MQTWPEHNPDQHKEDSDGDGGGQPTSRCQPALVHVKPVLLPLHQVQELSIQSLPVKIVNRILKRIFIALLAFTLVPAR